MSLFLQNSTIIIIIVKSLIHQRLRLRSKNRARLTPRLKDISAYAPKIQLSLRLD